MSPTEHDLRAALRDGEGDGPDPSRIVALGQQARAHRRTQLLNAAVITVIVAALGTGGTLLLNRDGHDQNSADKSAAGPVDSRTGTFGGANAAGGSAASAGAARVPRHPAPHAATQPPAKGATDCPAAAPATPTAAPGTGTGNSSGPLFRGSPVRLAICVYADTSGSRPAAIALTGPDAQAVAASLESAPTSRRPVMCPNYRLAGERTALITGFGADGQQLGTVTASLDRPACAVVVTNGTQMRYGWTPPSELTTRLGPVDPGGGLSHGPVPPASSPSR